MYKILYVDNNFLRSNNLFWRLFDDLVNTLDHDLWEISNNYQELYDTYNLFSISPNTVGIFNLYSGILVIAFTITW